MTVIVAQRAGQCEECVHGIRPGQNITPTQKGGWQHAVCPPDRRVCPDCFMEIANNGACLCGVI